MESLWAKAHGNSSIKRAVFYIQSTNEYSKNELEPRYQCFLINMIDFANDEYRCKTEIMKNSFVNRTKNIRFHCVCGQMDKKTKKWMRRSDQKTDQIVWMTNRGIFRLNAIYFMFFWTCLLLDLDFRFFVRFEFHTKFPNTVKTMIVKIVCRWMAHSWPFVSPLCHNSCIGCVQPKKQNIEYSFWCAE